MNDHHPEDPEIEATICPVDPLVCQTTGWRGKTVSVIVDRAAGMIHFQNCHKLNGFWTIKVQPHFSCRLDDLQGARRHCVYGRTSDVHWVTITTPAGKASLGEEAINYELLCGLLSDLVASRQRKFDPESSEVAEGAIPQRRDHLVDFGSRLMDFAMKQFAAILVFGFILYLAFNITMSGVGVLMEASRSKSWPTVEGTVTVTRVDQQTDSKGRINEVPVVRYQYEVSGKQYQRGKLSLDGSVTTSWSENASSVIARYAVGKPVKVYYDRQHPENAVLEPGTTARMWATLWPGALFWLVIAVCVMSVWRGMKDADVSSPKTSSNPN